MNEIPGQEKDDVLNISIDDLFKDLGASETPQEENTEDHKNQDDDAKKYTESVKKRINDVRTKTETLTKEKIAKDLGYASYAEMMSKKESKAIEDSGLDPETFDELVKPIIEARLANDPRMVKLEALEKQQQDLYLKEELDKINKLTGSKFTNAEELPKEAIDLWSKGIDLSKAYIAVSGEELLNKKNQFNPGTTAHLTPSNSRTEGKVRGLTNEEKAMYRSILPDITDEELSKKTMPIK